MPWRYEMRFDPAELPTWRPRPRFFFTNGVDTDIEVFGGRGVLLRYSATGLTFEMRAGLDQRGVPLGKFRPPLTDSDAELGPTCSLHLDERTLSRELTATDFPRIAADFKSAMALYLEVPGSAPPKIERIVFYNDFLAPFSGPIE